MDGAGHGYRFLRLCEDLLFLVPPLSRRCLALLVKPEAYFAVAAAPSGSLLKSNRFSA